MTRTRALHLLFAGLVALMGTCTAGHAFDPARSARESIIQSVRDDVRRQVLTREQRFRDSRAEFGSDTSEVAKRKVRIH